MSKVPDSLLHMLFKQNKDGDPELKGFWYSVFRPVGNRYYVGMKLYTITFLIRYVPLIVLLVLGAIKYPSLAWFLLLAVVAAGALIDHFVVYKWEEKISWKYLYSAHYEKDDSSSEAEALMKAVEQNPSEENLRNLKSKLGGK
ncbi:MAG: hypothetical protein JWO96_13 [Candidatus Saccharibacteria bacterium]|nr:hypothetical protein [Candidatus Saccharibacteria bacterium]